MVVVKSLTLKDQFASFISRFFRVSIEDGVGSTKATPKSTMKSPTLSFTQSRLIYKSIIKIVFL